MDTDRELILEEELLILRHSGEIPEIALHSTLYYLCEDPEGPGLVLAAEERDSLLDMALVRAREIVLRDLDPANRDLGMYRGVKRSIDNWRRYLRFCERNGRDGRSFAGEVRRALLDFLIRELADVESGARRSCVNCSREELAAFARDLGLAPDQLPAGWQGLCPAGEGDR